MSKRDSNTMRNAKRDTQDDLILNTLHQNWEGAVSMGLRGLSDDDLLRLLSEVNSHVDDADDRSDQVFCEVPDWDERTPAELEMIARQFELQIGGGTSSSAAPVRAPLRRRQAPSPASLKFEELESRFSPTSLTIIAHGRTAFVPASQARWGLAEVRVAAPAWQTPQTLAAAQSSAHDHFAMDFDSEALGHMALAQVA
jgi:hypothetical protein